MRNHQEEKCVTSHVYSTMLGLICRCVQAHKIVQTMVFQGGSKGFNIRLSEDTLQVPMNSSPHTALFLC